MRRSIAVVYLTCVGAGLLAVHAQMHKKPFASENSLVQVSGQSHFPPGCPPQQSGIDYMNSAVEPQVATDPTNPQHLIGVWQQDRWSNGGATATLTGVSFDGGRTWKQISARTGVCDGGSTTLASDPWVTISPNGVAYQSALGLTRTAGSTETAVLVSRSSDGGISWGDVTVVDSSKSDDKETITADPIDAHYVYAVWDRNGAAPNSLANWFSRSVDGGLTWEPAHPIYDPGPNNYASINQIVVLTDGTLLDVFLLTRGDSPTMIAAMRSTDRGATWSAPVAIALNLAIGVVDSRTQAGVRTGLGIPSSAVDSISGTIYVAWEDGRFSGGQREGVALVKSTDGGTTWSQPAQVNQVPEVQAFNPVVAVGTRNTLLGPRGLVGMTYFDFRQAGEDASTLPTTYWQIVSADGGSTWLETMVAGPFDMLKAPRSGNAYFLGDYHGLAVSGEQFVPFFASTATSDTNILSNILARPFAGPPVPKGSGWRGRVEVNHNPKPFHRHEPLRR